MRLCWENALCQNGRTFKRRLSLLGFACENGNQERETGESLVFLLGSHSLGRVGERVKGECVVV